ncbi:MAG: TetR family transcriptional regulator C-terminal domain-containing protein [Rhodospirillales bacterium]|nr:TetR family transcriptional regulator C-terminal domain-containing protein [Rhodospirillales bacterium]
MTLDTMNSGRSDRTASRKARRRQLIRATIDSVAKRGLSDTTLATVTNGAKLSHGTINFHFRSKERLLVETLKFLSEEHHDHWRGALKKAGPTPQEQLTALVETDFDPVICSPKKLAVWFAYWGEAKVRPAYLDICGSYDLERLAEMTRLSRLLKEDGRYDRIDPSLVAQSLETLIDGLWLNMLLYPQIYPRESARRNCMAFLAGMFPHHFPLAAAADCTGHLRCDSKG